MTSPVADPSVYTDLQGLAALKRDARAQDPGTLREVARQFESIFAKMMLSSMRQASFGDSLFGSEQQEFYQGMFDDQLAVELTKGRGLGLADLLVQQLTRAGLVPEGAEGDAAAGTGTGAGSGISTGSGTDPLSSAAGVASKKGALRIGASGSAEIEPTSFLAPARGARGPDTGSSISASSIVKSREDFLTQLWPCAEEAGRELGVDPRHLLAQAALETGWGKSLPCDAKGNPSFNLFGIKAGDSWNGNSVSVRTLEFEGGIPVPRQAKFRAYDSVEESFRDYVALLRDNPRYADALNTGSDVSAFAAGLQRGGYATDPAYAQKIAAITQNLPISATSLKSSADSPMNPTTATR